MDLQKVRVGRQKGVSLVGFIIIMAMVAVLSLLVMKLFPAYNDNFKISQAMTGLQKTPGLKNATRKQIINALNKRLYINYGDKVVDINKTLKIKKHGGKRVVHVDYEVVIPLVYNISALLTFDNSAELQ